MDPDAQNDWITAQLRIWQTAWHDLYGRDPNLAGNLEFPRPAPLEDMGCDVRLHFGFLEASAATRARCLGLFPAGAEMARRIEAYLSERIEPASEAEARAQLDRIVVLLRKASPTVSHSLNLVSGLRVIDIRSSAAWMALTSTGPFDSLIAWPPMLAETPLALQALAAWLFLSNPLYDSAGNHYGLCSWVTAAMAPAEVDPVFSALYRLWRSGWQVFVTKDEVVLGRYQDGHSDRFVIGRTK